MAPVFDFDKNIVINNSVNSNIENEDNDNLTDYNGSGDEYDFTNNIKVCEGCLETYEISDDCICCKYEISFVQKNYIITSLDIFNKCIYCLSKDDEKIKNDYINYLTLNYSNHSYFEYWINEANGINSKNNSDSFNQVDLDNLKIEENINPLNENDNYNIIEVDTLYKGITENMKHYDYLTRNTIMNLFGKILTDFEMDYNYISLKESNNIYVLYNNEKDDKNLDILKNNKKYTPQVDDDDLYLIKFKHKKINCLSF